MDAYNLAKGFDFDKVDNYLVQNVCKKFLSDPNEYIPGKKKIQFYGDLHWYEDRIKVHDPLVSGMPYEDVILMRLVSKSDYNTTVILGDIGSGKSTALWYILDKLKKTWELEIVKQANCRCDNNRCLRYPITIECVDLPINSSYDATHKHIYSIIYNSLENQLINELLEIRKGSNKVNCESITDEQKLILKASIICNDLQFYISEMGTLGNEPFPNIEPRNKLFSQESHNKSISVLTLEFRQNFKKYRNLKSKLLNDEKSRENLVGALLSYCTRNCPDPSRTIFCVDNLDSLGSDVIDKLINSMSSVFRNFQKIKLLLPVRPSSLKGTPTFVDLVDCVYHYGPDPFVLAYKRIFDYITSKSQDYLRAEIGFNNDLKKHELEYFVATTILYQQILEAGIEQFNSPGSYNIKELKKAMHKDHAKLNYLIIDKRIAKGVAGTLHALTGSNARAAIRIINRFYASLHNDWQTLWQSMEAIKRFNKNIYVGDFKYLVGGLLFDKHGRLAVRGTENLFASDLKGADGSSPSLTRIYILKLLKIKGRMAIGQIVSELGQRGITRKATLFALQSLYDEECFLIWFSVNKALESMTNSTEAAISERGAHYLENLNYRFDYLWACKASISNIQFKTGEDSFPSRLELVAELITELAKLERGHILYRRCSIEGVEFSEGLLAGHKMYTLELAYNAIADLAEMSSNILPSVARRYRVDKENWGKYTDKVCTQIDQIIDMIMFCEKVYSVVNGNTAYKKIYEMERKTASIAIDNYNKVLEDNDIISNRSVQFSNSIKEIIAEYINILTYDKLELKQKNAPILDKTIQYAGAIFNLDKIPNFLKIFKTNILVTGKWKRIQTSIIIMGELLEKTIPRADSVIVCLTDIINEIEILINIIKIDGTLTDIKNIPNWEEAVNKLKQIENDIEEVQYSVELKTYIESEIKGNMILFKKYMAVLKKLAVMFSVSDSALENYNIE